MARRDPLQESLPGLGGAAGIGLVLAVLGAAVYWPNAADGLLRLLLITLAIGYIGLRGFEAIPPLADERGSPFGREPLLAPHSTPPQPLYDLMRQFRREVASSGADARMVPPQVCRMLREEAQRRLLEGHRLNLASAAHHPRIRELVSEPIWRLVAVPEGRATQPRLIPLSQLDSILDDLERL